MDAERVSVRDDPEESRYVLLVDGERAGRIEYLAVPGAVVLVHTEVAEELEGHGLGGRLVAGALDDLRERGLRVVTACPFAGSYIERHPEYRELVAELPEELPEAPERGG